MKNHIKIKSVRNVIGNAYAGLFVLCFFAFAISGQAPPVATPAQENIPTGAFIIPMDNYHQGNNSLTTFNLRAYGLANLLLQNDIPVKWAIKPGKAKDDPDFTVSFTRIQGSPTGDPSGTNVAFSGAPFIVMPEYAPVVLTLLGTFSDVTVYRTTQDKLIDIRYTLTHKPKVAIGPDGGNFGTGVHQNIMIAAGMSDYFKSVTDDLINSSSCFSLATQAHSTDPTFVNLYRQFTQSGGNLLLQCASINTFENNALGHFQTTNPGYSVFGTNAPANAVDTTLIYPAGAMPFNQFIGILANQDGAITEYAYAPGGGPANGNLVSVRNSDPHSEKFVATVSQLNGTSQAGGVVFELGGHDYTRNNTGASNIAKLNGQRMFLNAIFVPVTRPTACGFEQPRVLGYKSVRRIVNLNGGLPASGDTVRWTIDYINNSPVAVSGFQIRDIIEPKLTLVPGSNTVTVTSGGATAFRNPAYDGAGNDITSDLLLPGAFLPVNGRIQVTVDTVIKFQADGITPLDFGTVLMNQTIASGSNLVSTTNSDNIDATNTTIFGVPTPPSDSILQPQNPASIDPTILTVVRPTAADASIEGSVRDRNSNGIANALVTATNASTGASTSVRTNSFGQYLIEGLPVGELYLVRVEHKRFRFPNGTITFTLNDSVTGLAFIGNLPDTKAGARAVTNLVKLR